MNADSPSQNVLSYRRFRRHHPAPNPLLATLLHLPGSICWVILMAAATNCRPMVRFTDRDALVLVLWVVALITALASVLLYARAGVRKTGYVVFNLAINTCGLIFTALVSPLVLIYFFKLTARH